MSTSASFGVMGYRQLPGISLDPSLLGDGDTTWVAAGIAGFLLALHQFPVDEAWALGLADGGRAEAELVRLRDEVSPALRTLLTSEEYQKVTAWWDALLLDEEMRASTPVVQHGDLWYENILVDPAARRVAGVLDFEHAAIGDPAQDFAIQYHLGEDFANEVIARFRTAGGTLDAGFYHRLRKHWELREFGGLRFALKFDDLEELEDALQKLRRGQILSG